MTLCMRKTERPGPAGIYVTTLETLALFIRILDYYGVHAAFVKVLAPLENPRPVQVEVTRLERDLSSDLLRDLLLPRVAPESAADAAAAECNALRAKVELAQRSAPLLEERGILDKTDKPCTKHVRIDVPTTTYYYNDLLRLRPTATDYHDLCL